MALPEEIVEEIILHLPPAEPASLVRAALVCKPWRGLISSPRFRRRFREFHRTPPILGFILNIKQGEIALDRFVLSSSSFRTPPELSFIRNTSKEGGVALARFVPSSSFRPRSTDHLHWFAHDARHGYVLLSSSSSVARPHLFAVWNPMTDEWWQLPSLVLPQFDWNATVLCAASGAGHHLDCLHGTFLVVLARTHFFQTIFRVYSSESGSWSKQTVALHCEIDEVPLAALVGNTIYFSTDGNSGLLSYDLATWEASLNFLPPHDDDGGTALMTMEDGGLGVARGSSDRVSLWSMEESSNGDIEWAKIRVIELEKLLPAKAFPISPTVLVFAPGIEVLFVQGDDGFFTIDLKSDEVKKVLDCDENHVVGVVPYMSFYTPALGPTTTDEGPGVDASRA